MSEVYRRHEIVPLDTTPRSIIIIERLSGAALPTKIVFWPGEAEQLALQRARQLIDIYLDGPPPAQLRPTQSLTL